MGKMYAYVRVSTLEQNEDRQLIAMSDIGIPSCTRYADICILNSLSEKRKFYLSLLIFHSTSDIIVLTLFEKRRDLLKNDNDYESIYKGNRQKLINYCISRGQSRDKAEDIAQEALKRLFENWLEVKECEERQIVHWLRKAVNNIIHEQIRQDYKHNTVNLDDVEPFLSDNFDIDRNILDEEYLNSIEKCLDEDDRKLFVLQFIEMEDSKSIAEKFGVNDQALRTRKSRLKTRIVDIIEKTK